MFDYSPATPNAGLIRSSRPRGRCELEGGARRTCARGDADLAWPQAAGGQILGQDEGGRNTTDPPLPGAQGGFARQLGDHLGSYVHVPEWI
eukprot:scaffold625_cov420-Prasinococcus_capsulatus_cf.AAC.50